MNDTTPASDLERRKKVRLRVRADLDIAPHKYEGRTYYVIKDPVSLRYYRFKEQEHFLLKMMDGRHSLDDAQKEFEKRFRPDRLTLEDLEQFGQQLLTAGLAQNESPQAGKQLFDRRKKRTRSEWMQTLTNILYIKIPVFDPERLLTWMLDRLLPALRRIEIVAFWLFGVLLLLDFLAQVGSRVATFDLVAALVQACGAIFLPLKVWSIWAAVRMVLKIFGWRVLSVVLMSAALVLVLSNWRTFQDKVPNYHEFFNFKNVIYMWASLGVVKVIHEFGHGLSCKAYGGEVHEMGLLFLCFSPCMYCNVSDAWTLPSKWQRIVISGAGIYVELMIAAVATFVWWNSSNRPFINNLSLSLMVVCSVSTIFFNGNPLMRYDGYYVLADWIEIPNLRDRSNRYLQRLVMDYCMGIEVQPEPYMAFGRRLLFVTYAVISWVYRWVVTFVILKFMATFLKPYKLEIISNMLAVAALASMVGWPLWRLGKNIYKRGRLPDMKGVRMTITSIVVAALLLAFFLVPLPLNLIHETGLVEVRPDAIESVPVVMPSTPVKILVTQGQYVRKGAELAVFDSFTHVGKKEIALRAQVQQQVDQLAKFRPELSRAETAEEAGRLSDKIRETEITKVKLEKDLAALLQQKENLVLRAKRDGYVMSLPPKDEQLKPWDMNSLDKFCQIGDPTKLRILIPVMPRDYDIIRSNLEKNKKNGEKLAATLRVHGFGGQLWKGYVSLVPDDAAKTVPLALTTKGGGPLAAKPISDGQQKEVEPQGQVYLIGIDFEDPDRSIVPGMLGQAKIHCEHHSCAWWAWRWLSGTFDLGLW